MELRWVTRDVPITVNGDNCLQRVRVLQFRTQVMHLGYGYSERDGIIHQHERPQGWSWTEWQDVPEASEQLPQLGSPK